MRTDNVIGSNSLRHEALGRNHDPGRTQARQIHTHRDIHLQRICHLPRPQNLNRDPASSQHVRYYLGWRQSQLREICHLPQVLGQQSVDQPLSKDRLRSGETCLLTRTCLIWLGSRVIHSQSEHNARNCAMSTMLRQSATFLMTRQTHRSATVALTGHTEKHQCPQQLLMEAWQAPELKGLRRLLHHAPRNLHHHLPQRRGAC